MRRWINFIVGTIFFLFTGCAGMQPITEANRTFEKVYEAPSYSREEIFNGTKVWIAENFKSAKAVLEYENKDTGTIIGNGIISYPCNGLECITKADWKVPFTMRVDIKDQKFRLTFSNLHLSWPPSYNRTLGAQPGHDGPIGTQSDLDAVKPELLKFGNQILASFRQEKIKSDW